MANQVETLAAVLRTANLQAAVWQRYNMNRVYIKKMCGVPNSSKLFIDFPEFNNDDWSGKAIDCLDNTIIKEKTRKGWTSEASEHVIQMIEAIVEYYAS